MNPDESVIPRIPLGDWVDNGFDWLKANLSWLFDLFSAVMNFLIGNLTDLLVMIPPVVLIPIFALIALTLRSWKLAVGSLIGFLLIVSMDQWETTMQTMALVLIATLAAVIIAVPLGILAAVNSTVSAIVKPVMDFMQTMPAFGHVLLDRRGPRRVLHHHLRAAPGRAHDRAGHPPGRRRDRRGR